MDNERIVGGGFLALFFFGWFLWMLSKTVTRVFHDLGMMFDAIETATTSFFGMAWAITQVVVILGAGAAIAYAGPIGILSS